MRQKRTFVTLLLVIAILCLGIAYAAITNTTLNISGNAAAEVVGKDTPIDVTFTEAKVGTTVEGAKVTPVADGDATATIEVSGLTTAGQTVSAVYTIQNNRTDVAAKLDAPVVDNGNEEWFEVTSSVESNNLAAKSDEITTDTTTATVTVKLLKTPVTAADVTAAKATIGIDIVASPVGQTPEN